MTTETTIVHYQPMIERVKEEIQRSAWFRSASPDDQRALKLESVTVGKVKRYERDNRSNRTDTVLVVVAMASMPDEKRTFTLSMDIMLPNRHL